MFTGFKTKLAPLFEEDTSSDEGKEPIPEAELADAKSSLKEVVPMMDYDAVEMILNQLDDYRLEEEDFRHVQNMKKLLKLFDWDGMENEIGAWEK